MHLHLTIIYLPVVACQHSQQCCMVLLHAENNSSSLEAHMGSQLMHGTSVNPALCCNLHAAHSIEKLEVLHGSPALHMRKSWRMIFGKLMQC